MDAGDWLEIVVILLGVAGGLALLVLLMLCWDKRRARRAAGAPGGRRHAPPSGHALPDSRSRVPPGGRASTAAGAPDGRSPVSPGGRSLPVADETGGRHPVHPDGLDPPAVDEGVWSFWRGLRSSTSNSGLEPSTPSVPLGGRSPPVDDVTRGRSPVLPGDPNPVVAGKALWSFWSELRSSTSSSDSEPSTSSGRSPLVDDVTGGRSRTLPSSPDPPLAGGDQEVWSFWRELRSSTSSSGPED